MRLAVIEKSLFTALAPYYKFLFKIVYFSKDSKKMSI